MPSINVSKARAEFPEILNRVAYGKERIVISRHGKPLAAVVPIEDLRPLERRSRKAGDRIDLKAARAVLKRAKKKGAISARKAKKLLGL